MPRYHFNVLDGERERDADGIDLSSWRKARLGAIRYAGEVLRDDPKRIAENKEWHMEVTDDTGLVLFSLDFSVMAEPALQAQRSSA